MMLWMGKLNKLLEHGGWWGNSSQPGLRLGAVVF